MKRSIFLVRHGQCEMNLTVADRVGGRSNASPLTDLGRKQLILESAAASTPGLAPQATPQVTLSDSLLELEQGEWEGRLRAACYTPDTLALIARDPWNFAPPGGESQRQVEERITAYIQSTVLPAVEPGGPPALVVSHGLAIKCFLRGVLGSEAAMTRRIGMGNTGVTQVSWTDGDGWEVDCVNDLGHLRAAGLTGG